MNDLQKKIIIQAQDNLESLSDWQRGFISDLAEKPETYSLSIKQNHELNKIWEAIQS